MQKDDICELVDVANKVCMDFSQKLKQTGATKRMIEALNQMKKSLDELNKISIQEEWEQGSEMKEVGNLIMKQRRRSDIIKKIEQKNKNIEEPTQTKKQVIKNQIVENQALESSGMHKNSRGPYRQYSQQIKENVIQLFKQGVPFSKISKTFNIPSKNIIRWCKNGPYRKPGAGRKVLDPQMQEKVYLWIQKNYEIGQRIDTQVIRNKAKEFSIIQGFFASLGWFKNFEKRYGLKDKYSLS